MRVVTAMFSISKTYRQIFPRQDDQPGQRPRPLCVTRSGRPSLVPADLERSLVPYIGQCQDRNDFMSPRECREWLANELLTPTRTVIIDRYWRHRFLARHAELAVHRWDSREASRAEVNRQQIAPDILGRLSRCKTPRGELLLWCCAEPFCFESGTIFFKI
jgi:hypothetical protein